MQEFKMPLRELGVKFTKSEIAVMSWYSKEQAFDLENRYKQTSQKAVSEDSPDVRPPDLSEVPKEYINEDGEVDLRKMKGQQAWQFLQNQGIKFPIVRRG